ASGGACALPSCVAAWRGRSSPSRGPAGARTTWSAGWSPCPARRGAVPVVGRREMLGCSVGQMSGRPSQSVHALLELAHDLLSVVVLRWFATKHQVSPPSTVPPREGRHRWLRSAGVATIRDLSAHPGLSAVAIRAER